jgi:hypothetical protein
MKFIVVLSLFVLRLRRAKLVVSTMDGSCPVREYVGVPNPQTALKKFSAGISNPLGMYRLCMIRSLWFGVMKRMEGVLKS